jgi:hypothetical protein
MARELATPRVVLSSATELVLGCSPDETFLVEITDELVTEFQRLQVLVA